MHESLVSGDDCSELKKEKKERKRARDRERERRRGSGGGRADAEKKRRTETRQQKRTRAKDGRSGSCRSAARGDRQRGIVYTADEEKG